MKFWRREEAPLDRHIRIHDELLDESKRLLDEAEAQKLQLVEKANGSLIDHVVGLGGSRNAGKSGTKL